LVGPPGFEPGTSCTPSLTPGCGICLILSGPIGPPKSWHWRSPLCLQKSTVSRYLPQFRLLGEWAACEVPESRQNQREHGAGSLSPPIAHVYKYVCSCDSGAPKIKDQPALITLEKRLNPGNHASRECGFSISDRHLRILRYHLSPLSMTSWHRSRTGGPRQPSPMPGVAARDRSRRT
jgi:hypothetical protein